MKIQTLTVRKTYDYQNAEVTVSIDDPAELPKAMEALQKLTSKLLDDTINSVQAEFMHRPKTDELRAEAKRAASRPANNFPQQQQQQQGNGNNNRPRQNNNFGGAPKTLSPGQINYSKTLQKQNKLPHNFDPYGPDAYNQFRAAAGDRDGY